MPPRLLFIDSGLGGLTILKAVRAAIPQAQVHYIADDAGFPYGSKTDDEVTARLLTIAHEARAVYAPDCIVLACNTASTIALPALRAAIQTPIVGTVPAIKPAAQLTESGLVSVLATPATAQRDYTRALIAQFGGGADIHIVGAPELAALAENFARGESVDDAAIFNQIAPCFLERGPRRTDVVVLGCTHYPLLLDKLEALSPWPVTWLDPAPAIAKRVLQVLSLKPQTACVQASAPRGTFAFTSGLTPPSALNPWLETYGLAVR